MAGLLAEPVTWVLIAWGAVAGAVRGFAGFGVGLLFIPVASALVGPHIAVLAVWAIDTLPVLPILLPALKVCNWRTILPVAVGSGLAVGFGARLLATADPLILRWAMCALVLALAALLALGLRYRGAPRTIPSVGVGLASGLLGGATQLSGPPVVAYWLSGPDPAFQVRANLIVFFAIATVASGIAFLANGLFTREAFLTAVAIAPAYALAVILGQRAFRRSTERAFRSVAYGLIVLAAIVSAPVFDALWKAP